MHGQRKVKEIYDEAQRRLTEEKISSFRALYDEAFRQLHAQNYSRDVLTILDALLEVSPEQYTLFGYRRNILLRSWRQPLHLEADEEPALSNIDPVPPTPTAAVSDEVDKDLDREFQLNTRVILKDFKVYSAFVHRRWILERIGERSEAKKRDLLLGELKKCEALLKMDERNFHAWGYRRWVTGQLRGLAANNNTTANSGVEGATSLCLYSDAEEWAFTTSKIQQNFSNYSAWHNRAMLIQNQVRQAVVAATTSSTSAGSDITVEGAVTTCRTDLDLCTKAFYCDPNDQSAWLYAEFLLSELQSLSASSPHGVAGYEAAVSHMIQCCDELQEVVDEELAAESEVGSEGEAVQSHHDYVTWMKWMLLRKHAATSSTMRKHIDGDEGSSGTAGQHQWGSAELLLQRLRTRDFLRRGMYH